MTINSGNNWKKKDGRRESTLQIPKKFCNWGSESISIGIVGSAYFIFKPMEEKLTNLQLYFSILCSTPQTTTTTTTP